MSAPTAPPSEEYNSPPPYNASQRGYAQPYPSYPQPQGSGYTNPQVTGYGGGTGYGGAPGYPPGGAGYPTGGAGYGGGAGYQYNGGQTGGNVVGPTEDTGFSVGNSFSDKAIRHNFIKKVYLILMTQLLFTVGVICLFLFCTPIKNWVQSNSWFYYVSYAVFLVIYFVLICVPSARRNYPANFICLSIFTMALSYMAATITSYYGVQLVLIAMAITAAVCLAVSLFAIQTKIDFTLCAGLLFGLCLVVLLFGLSVLIVYLITGPSFSTYVMQCVYGGLIALLMVLFLIFDTQMVVGGKNRKNALSPEEYVYGSLQLYLDIVYLLLAMVQLSGAASK